MVFSRINCTIFGSTTAWLQGRCMAVELQQYYITDAGLRVARPRIQKYRTPCLCGREMNFRWWEATTPYHPTPPRALTSEIRYVANLSKCVHLFFFTTMCVSLKQRKIVKTPGSQLKIFLINCGLWTNTKPVNYKHLPTKMEHR